MRFDVFIVLSGCLSHVPGVCHVCACVCVISNGHGFLFLIFHLFVCLVFLFFFLSLFFLFFLFLLSVSGQTTNHHARLGTIVSGAVQLSRV
jgi:hypothetical protein